MANTKAAEKVAYTRKPTQHLAFDRCTEVCPVTIDADWLSKSEGKVLSPHYLRSDTIGGALYP